MIRTVKKLCKYCKKPGRFHPVLRKVLCEEHRYIENNIRSLWEAITHIQLEVPRSS